MVCIKLGEYNRLITYKYHLLLVKTSVHKFLECILLLQANIKYFFFKTREHFIILLYKNMKENSIKQILKFSDLLNILKAIEEAVYTAIFKRALCYTKQYSK